MTEGKNEQVSTSSVFFYFPVNNTQFYNSVGFWRQGNKIQKNIPAKPSWALLRTGWDYQVHESKLYTRACMTLEEASDETETVSFARVCIKNMYV